MIQWLTNYLDIKDIELNKDRQELESLRLELQYYKDQEKRKAEGKDISGDLYGNELTRNEHLIDNSSNSINKSYKKKNSSSNNTLDHVNNSGANNNNSGDNLVEYS